MLSGVNSACELSWPLSVPTTMKQQPGHHCPPSADIFPSYSSLPLVTTREMETAHLFQETYSWSENSSLSSTQWSSLLRSCRQGEARKGGGGTAVTRASVALIQSLKIHLPLIQVMPFRIQQLWFIPFQVDGTKPRKRLWESNMAAQTSIQRVQLQVFYIPPLYDVLSAKRLIPVLPHTEYLLSLTRHSGILGFYSLTRWGGRSWELVGVVLHSFLIWLPSEFYI